MTPSWDVFVIARRGGTESLTDEIEISKKEARKLKTSRIFEGV